MTGSLDAVDDRFHGSAAAVPEHHDQLRAQAFDHVLDAGVACVVQGVAGSAHHEQVTQTAVKKSSQAEHANRSSR